MAKRPAKFTFFFFSVALLLLLQFFAFALFVAELILFYMEIFSMPQPHPEVVGVYVINCGPDTLRAKRSFARRDARNFCL